MLRLKLLIKAGLYAGVGTGGIFAALEAASGEGLVAILEHGLSGGAMATVILYYIFKGRMDNMDTRHESVEKQLNENSAEMMVQSADIKKIARDTAKLVGAQEERRLGIARTRSDDDIQTPE